MYRHHIHVDDGRKDLMHETFDIIHSQYFGDRAFEGRDGSGVRINEAIKHNTKKLTGLSNQKKGSAQNFFTKPQKKDRSATIYRITYGEDSIPKASESEHKPNAMKAGTFVPKEYKEYVNKPHKLPLFLKDKLLNDVKPKRNNNQLPELPTGQLSNRNGDWGQLSISKSGFIHGDTTPLRSARKYKLATSSSDRHGLNSGDMQYLSPKARWQMNSKAVPILMSNVFLTGQINPQGFTNSAEPAIEHIINEHHIRSRETLHTAEDDIADEINYREGRKRLDKHRVAQVLNQQDKRKHEQEAHSPGKGQKYGIDKVGMKLKATVGHLRQEREQKRKRILGLLKTKNFNLFRPNTINNLHLLKDALVKE